MAECFANGHLRFCSGAWRDDNGDPVEIGKVVHGRWIFKHDPINDPKRYFVRIVCSECNLHTGQKANYCPNCGAKMDLEGRTDNA